MAISISAREARLVQRYPVLKQVPAGQRLPLARQAARERSVWGPPLLALVLLLPLLWLGVSWGQANLDRTWLAVTGGLVGGFMVAACMQFIYYTHGKAIHRLVTR